MKNRVAKLLSIFLVIALLVVALPVRMAVYAEEDDQAAETKTENAEGDKDKGSGEDKTPTPKVAPESQKDKTEADKSTPTPEPDDQKESQAPTTDGDKESDPDKTPAQEPQTTEKPEPEPGNGEGGETDISETTPAPETHKIPGKAGSTGGNPVHGYTLTLNPNYEEAAVGMYNDVTTMVLPSANRSNFFFMGWAESADGEVKYSAGQEITLTGNLTLYAIWDDVPPSPSYALSPSKYTLNGSGYTDITCTLTSLKLGNFKNYGNEYVEVYGIDFYLNAGTLSDNNKHSIPFQVSQTYGDLTSRIGHFSPEDRPWSGKSAYNQGETIIMAIYIDPDVYANAVPGTYKGTFTYDSDWLTDNGNFPGASGSIELTLVVPEHVKHTVTVNNGTGGGSYAEGANVTITANAPEAGKQFKEWTGTDGLTFRRGNATSSTATFTMPDKNVEVTATYKDAEYTIKVNNGNANPATATAGTVITLTADAAPSGKVFDKWIVNSETVSLSNASSTTTTFTMPAENVEVTATYIDVEYTIKVNNGVALPATNNTTASRITALAETKIILTADDAPSGKVFDKWIVVSGSVKLANSGLSSVTWFTMPAENVEVTATYKTVPSGNYIIKANNGVATPSTSAPGLVVNVKANDAPAGTEFEKWEVVSGTVIFADSTSATTYFVMPAANVEITAKYKSKLSVKGKTATVKYSKVKKKNQTLAVSKVLTFVDKGQGKLTYAKVSGNSKILINKTTGAITVKKKLKKKTYTVKVKVMASGDNSCNPSGWKTVTFKIKVK